MIPSYYYYNIRKRFEVLRISKDFKFVIASEEIYDALKVAHATVGHGGENKSIFRVKKNGQT